jgi:hypothetical protein
MPSPQGAKVDLRRVQEQEEDQRDLGNDMEKMLGFGLRKETRAGQRQAKGDENHGCCQDSRRHTLCDHGEAGSESS